MRLSDITGTASPTDNVTAFYTFGIGIVGGGFIAIGLSDIDYNNDLNGSLIKTYIPILTAMVGGGIGLLGHLEEWACHRPAVHGTGRFVGSARLGQRHQRLFAS